MHTHIYCKSFCWNLNQLSNVMAAPTSFNPKQPRAAARDCGKHSPSVGGAGAGGDMLSIPLVSVMLLALFS